MGVDPLLSHKIAKQDHNPEHIMQSRVVFVMYLEPVTEILVTKFVYSLETPGPGFDSQVGTSGYMFTIKK